MGSRRFQSKNLFSDRLKLTIQLYLDVNELEDNLYSPPDPARYLPVMLQLPQASTEALDDYVNLYFDIGELYRRKWIRKWKA